MTVAIRRSAERHEGSPTEVLSGGNRGGRVPVRTVRLRRSSCLFLVPAAVRRLRGPDRWCLAVLVVLPLAVFVLPALLGHMALTGDDVTQNYPLRELVGSQIRLGHLPLFDPYVWSGAPLLGGWNAGAAYPFVLLFVLLPGAAAWTLTLVVTWWVAGIGCFAFLRASRLASVPSFLGALSFSFAGAMTAQIAHIGLVEGMSWAPVALFALLRLSERAGGAAKLAEVRRTTRKSPLGWMALLGVAGAMVILAGEPRAITNVAVIIALYATWRAVRLGRRAGPYLLWVAGGVLLAAALGAVQWLPGVDAVSTSQRAANSASLFSSGSLRDRWLLLMVVPDLLGGSGSFGQPSFLAHYNLPEVTSYVGLMPLVAAFALLGRLRLRRPAPEWLVWQVTALVGIVLALGGNTPLWHLLIRVPFFGGQRLQSRNILIADMGFAFLLAYWSDAWLADARARWGSRVKPVLAAGPGCPGARTTPVPLAVKLGSVNERRARILGAVAGLAAVATVAVGMAWGAGLLRWLGVSLGSATEDGGLRFWFLPFGVLGLAAVALVVWGHLLQPRRRTRALLGLVVVDVVTFTLMAVVSVLPSPGQASSGSITPAAGDATSRPAIGAQAIFPRAVALIRAPAATIAAATFTGSGRFAVYDPNGIDSNELSEIETPDLNVVGGVASVQGYGSIVDGTYASATGSHSPTGSGIDILDPRAIGDGTLNQLGTTVLFAPRDYFLVSASSDPAPPDPVAGERRLAAGGRATWYLGEDLDLTSIVLPDASAKADLNSGLRFGVVTSSGATLWAPAATLDSAHLLRVTFAQSVEAVALVADAGRTRTSLGSPSVTTANGAYFVADGQLEAVVVPPHWVFRGMDGSFAVFVDEFTLPALTLHGSSGASVHATAGLSFAPTVAAVSSPHGVEVIRSEAAIPGWTATWRPNVGPARRLSVRRVGVVQGVDVPPGSGVLTWTYDPPGWNLGWMLSACALAILLALLLWALVIGPRQRRRRDSSWRPDSYRVVGC